MAELSKTGRSIGEVIVAAAKRPWHQRGELIQNPRPDGCNNAIAGFCQF